MPGENVFVKRGEYMLPFSSWILTQAIMPTGIHPERAHAIAKEIGETLKKEGKRFVSPHSITLLIEKYLERVDPELPERYKVWHEYRTKREKGKIKEPLILLIGGGTGVGKSSVALEVAHRLGIRNVIGTDYVRQVLRTMFSEEILPDIYLSTFDAWEALRIPIAPGEDKVTVGYLEQTKHVSVGMNAIIDRAVKEGTDVILEGIHVFPGVIKEEYLETPAISILLLTIDNDEEHRIRLGERGKFSSRSSGVYLSKFKNIRKIQNYIIENSSARGIPVINNISFDKTVEAIIEKTTNNVRKILKS